MTDALPQSTEVLQLRSFINGGATRECYEMPGDPQRCVKVMREGKSPRVLEHELTVYQRLEPAIGRFLVPVYAPLVQTDKGIGMVQRLLRDDDGRYSRPIRSYSGGLMPREVKRQLAQFLQACLQHRVYFFDVNPLNFIVQYRGGYPYLCYSDLKSYNRYKAWTYLHLERVIPALAARIMRRRFSRMLGHVQLPPDEQRAILDGSYAAEKA